MSRLSSLSDQYEQLYKFLGRELPKGASQAQANARSIALQDIQIESVDGWVLDLLVRMSGAKKIVEIGSLTGFSASFLRMHLPKEGQLWCLELKAEHAHLARLSLGEDERVQILVGDARVQLESLETQGPFDLVFIDANKAAYFDYLLWSEKNLREGGLLVLDNILLHGDLLKFTSGQSGDELRFGKNQIDSVVKCLRHLESSPDWSWSVVPASDGFAVAIRSGNQRQGV